MDEEERRRRAIAALGAGRRPGDVCAEFERSREWLAKWQRRFAEAGLREQSRAPKHQTRQTEPVVCPRRACGARPPRPPTDLQGSRSRYGRLGARARRGPAEAGAAHDRADPRPRRADHPARARSRTSTPARHIPRRGPRDAETCSRPTWSGRATCAPRAGHCVSSPSTPSTGAAAGSRPGRVPTKAARVSAT